MRIGVVWDPCNNAFYRAIFPMKAMEQRGHEVVWPYDMEGDPNPARLVGCDVVHVFRRIDAPTQRLVKDLLRAGVPFTYDNDDDFTALPKESPQYKDYGGVKGQRLFTHTVKMARAARVFTTTNRVLAEKYRQAGAERVEVIGNYLPSGAVRSTRRHDGVVVGWIAGQEHRADVARIPIVEALERIVATHGELRVECIGVDLALSQKYRHDRTVIFHELPERIAGFDIGIAPLADLPMNLARSDIKVKEYAAAGVPWLASPIGPYAELGEEQGGRLVRDDEWHEALDRLASRGRERRKLGRKARKWAATQTIDAVAERWETVFLEAVSAPAPAAASG